MLEKYRPNTVADLFFLHALHLEGSLNFCRSPACCLWKAASMWEDTMLSACSKDSIFQGAVFLEPSLLTNSEKYLWISPEAKALSLDSHSLSEGKKMIHTPEKQGLIQRAEFYQASGQRIVDLALSIAPTSGGSACRKQHWTTKFFCCGHGAEISSLPLREKQVAPLDRTGCLF